MTTLLPAESAAKDRSKPVPINMRVDFRKRELIDVAAAISGSDRTSFILDAACKKAEEVILDQRLFVLANQEFDAFEQALESNPLRSNECLHRLLERPPRWS
jgi:uncharacterized protein (DUF1778 family)